jgi:lysophospholipase L1-like esterase
VFNAQGYRGKELAEHKEPREVRVFAFGDSNTLGWAGATGPSWPRYLDDLLAERDGGFVVINAGVWGYTAFQGLGRFKEALTFRPDLALFSFGANDAHRVSVPDAEFAGREVRRLRLDRILHRLRVGQVLLATLDKAQGRDGELVPRVSVSAYRKCLEEIIRLGRDHDVRIVLLTRPFVGDSPDPGWWKRFAPSYNTATVEVGTRERTPVIDAYEYFKDKDGYFSDESHFTEMGHRIMARLVHERIKPLLDDLERRRRASVAE